MTQLPPSTLTHDHATPERGDSLADRLHDGEEFAVTFGGQGTDWFGTLRELFGEDPDLARLTALVEESERLVAPVAGRLAPALPRPFEPQRWLQAEEVPAADATAAPGLGLPGVLLTQLATLDLLAAEGLDLTRVAPVASIGHSQGILGVAAFAGRREGDARSDVELLAIARLIGAAAGIVGRRAGLVAHGEDSPMLAVSGAAVSEIEALLAEVSDERDPAVVAAVNGPRRLVVSGSSAALRTLRTAIEARAAREASEIEQKTRGGRAFAPTLESVPVALGFHHPALAPAVALVREWAELCGLDAALAEHLAQAICVETVDWPRELVDAIGAQTDWVVDLGPADLSANMTGRALRGRGVTVVAAATTAGRDLLFTPGARVPRAADWAAYAPRLIDRGDGRPVVDTAFTRLTGKSPILLAGMTPTTVDPAIVAAAANRGHWAELAGGGQVSEAIFASNVARLTDLLDEGATAQFNTLFLDPYLWKMQVGGQRLVQKARLAGAPLDGLVISAGVPETEDAVGIIEDLHAAGIGYVVFKPGTVKQIRQVLAIARAVDTTVIAHIEGGVAGGHHSWEDLDELLLATYPELRATPNLVVCVGGGIGTPDRAVDYLRGTWSTAHGEAAMPVDGVLIGTAAMATLEATTSDSVKDLLVATPGLTPDQNGGWVGVNQAAGDVTSGRSQLGADIHEIDNAASRCGALLDQVAGDAEAATARKDELVAAMAATCKPYFGDVAAMTYEQVLRRYLELAGPRVAESVEGGPNTAGDWLDVTLRTRFEELLDRTLARVSPETTGEVERPYDLAALATDPAAAAAAVDTLVAAHPQALDCVLHPADLHFFVEVCRRPGKPVPFVPVIDADVRRWWRSDSLWQAHDEAYDADGVIVIPGPVAVAGITVKDEPVADLLDRFEAAVVADLTAADAPVLPAAGRTTVGDDVTLLDAARDAHDVVWAGRVVTNPLHRLTGTDATLEPVGDVATSRAAVLRVPLLNGELALTVDLSAVPAGGLPVISEDAVTTAMGNLLAVTAGGSLPVVTDGAQGATASLTASWTADLVADHVGVTDPTRRRRGDAVADPQQGAVPDTLVGLAWPAVFACIGPVEGLLDLVHLDHRIVLAETLGSLAEGTELTLTATRTGVVDATAGQVISVEVAVTAGDRPVADLTERFMVRGRTGEAALAAPAPVVTDAEDKPRARLDRFTVTAPHHMGAFAAVSGDHNPLHTDVPAARLAGFEGPIVHGMWTSAVAQRAAATVGATQHPRQIRSWLTRWVAPVAPGASVEVTVERTGVQAGDLVLEVSVKADGELAMVAEAVVAAPRTAYAFPGQGIQSQGMGLDARSRSAAARQVWDRADAHTREALGFSILAVVRDNPTTVWADGERHVHPDGVLFLTQFTQVAMATLAVAQVAEMREAGVFVEGAITCGHSVGEYNALAAVTGILPLEALLEIVFRRGMAMHHLVPRDGQGRSNYRLAAIRPSQIRLADDDVADFVAEIARESGEFIQIVNYNLRGSQYAIAGTVRGLEQLQDVIEERRARLGGKPAFILVPGIDVPFHSSELHAGVDDFRAKLDELLPATIDPTLLIGRYIPNLVPRLFSLDRSYVEEVAAYVDSPLLTPALADWDTWSADPSRLGRALLIELLAWQFASPVRWIETQDLLFGSPEQEFPLGHGIGIEQFVEVGVANAPTIANLATQTTKLASYTGTAPRIVNSSRDAAVVFATDTPVVEDDESEEAPSEPAATTATADAPAEAKPQAAAAPVAAAGADRPADLTYDAAAATTTLAALRTKVRPDQIGSADTIEALCDGVSSRRNQLLVDLGAELGLGAIDGAAEADWKALGVTVTKLARAYSAFGPVLTEAVSEQLRKFAGSVGAKPAAITDRVKDSWQLGPGWVSHVQATLALGLRDGSSTRGGSLGFDVDTSDLASAVDHAIAQVASAHGVTVGLPAGGSGGEGATVDAAALGEITASITGPDGVLASTARHLLGQLGLGEPGLEESGPDLDAELVALVERELGSDWARKVAPSFDAKRAVLLDDRWASVREDLARIWTGDDAVRGRSFAGLDAAALAQAQWWLDRARREQRTDLVDFYEHAVSGAEQGGEWSDDVAVVTGAAPGSIAAAVVADLLRGGATVVATTSRLDQGRQEFFKGLYRDHASDGAALWVLPANLASYADVDALVEWISSPVVEEAGGQRTELRPALSPTLVFPFAAPSVQGTAADAGPRAEVEFRVLVWGVERLVTGLAAQGADHQVGRRVHVVLPGSPNRGRFGGDGAYGEAKAAFDAFVQRWHAESDWAARVSFAHAHIGWVRGTGLMGGNDPLVGAVEAAGVRTWSPTEMASELLALCTSASREAAATEPVVVDLTGGLGEADLDLASLGRQAREQAAAAERRTSADGEASTTVRALTHPAGWGTAQATMDWAPIDADPADLVVIVGAGEVGPVGSARTRFELEVEDSLSPAGVLELAWTTGKIVWETSPVAGWHDAKSGEHLTEADVVERFGEEIEAGVGVRRYRDDNQMIDNTAPLMVSVFLEQDTSFVVRTRDEADAFAQADPARTRITATEDGDWLVTRLAGSEMRVPRRFKLSRFVGAQVPDGFDPAVWGLGSMVESADRLAAWNLVATVDAFVSSGFTPAELLRWVHPTQFANTQGTGIGGMQSTRRMYVDALLGEQPPNDVLQEALPNVVAAHTVQSYLGGYGSMVHPVAACATAAVSVEEGVDKIKLGKASVVVAGGFDDLGIEGILGFGNMSATADTASMLDKGIDERYVSRPNDRRRGGFVEGQGGGTAVLARGDVALEMGLPVLGVVAYAGSFADGIHTSIPAPGIGALGAGVGGTSSPLAKGLGALGLGADDLGVVYKHDTSTAANDPNESQLHEKLAAALGRTTGSPLFVVSQKSLTGHAKGGAAAFQLNGLCQTLAAGTIAPNRALDCVDEALSENEHLVWLRQALHTGPLKAGVLTSLGFGHVSAMIVVAHPGAFVAALPAERREAWLAQASARLVAGEARRLDAMHGGDPLFVKAEQRRFADADLKATKADESAMLVDPQARLGEDGVYARAGR
ncbi:fatty acid synthase, bacterial type [Nocardioides scoriae]|uniref:Fatty acid synthase, bacterial type n=1 Tax=Nocardioides scoriae TaxID=642780 RepID=A0A1H1Y519_9ACTN|nr:type I polyketide synthase [Nocardioides scoriae]SDT16126.1 fatty acid synthase, bacterial type [Nocardioides scoriae]